MKRLIPIVFLALPIALFAQSPQSPKARETAMLKGFGLSDSQIAQVFDIQNKTRTTIRQDAVELRLQHAQMEKALLPASPNMQEVNGYIAQMAQTRAELMKAFIGARVQLRQILGDDNFQTYARFIMHRRGIEPRRRLLGRSRPAPGAGGMLSQQPPAMNNLSNESE
jgi:hypothetical protein